MQQRIQLIRWLTAVRGLLSGKYISASSFFVYARMQNLLFIILNSQLRQSRLNSQFNIVIAKVLAAQGQLVVHQRGQHLLKLQEESFARNVTVGVHVERNSK